MSLAIEDTVREPYDFPRALVHEADIAAVAVIALLEDGHAGPAYNLTGPEALTPRERIAILAKTLGREITFTTISHQQAVDRLMATGVPCEAADYVIGWYTSPPKEAMTIDDTVEKVTGRPARTFAQWVDENAGRFRPLILAPLG